MLFPRSSEEKRNETLLYNPRKLSEIKSLPGHPTSWVDFVRDVVFTEDDIGEGETVIVSNPAFLEKLSQILGRRTKRTLANYLLMRAVGDLVAYLPKSARAAEQELARAKNGRKALPPRHKTCLRAVGFDAYTSGNLQFLAAAMYLKVFFPPEAKRVTTAMLDGIRGEFKVRVGYFVHYHVL